MKKKILLGVILIGILSIGGCDYIGEICSQIGLPEVLCGIITCVFGEEGLQNMANNPEVRNFLQTHPDAEITITLMPESNVLRNIETLSMELGAKPQIKDYIKLGLKEGSNTLTVLVDANTKELSYIKFGVSEQAPYKNLPGIDCNQIDDLCPGELEQFCGLLKYEYELCEKEEEKAPEPPKEEEIPEPAKEEPPELSKGDQEHIEKLKVSCARGVSSICLILKNQYGIDYP